MMQKRLKEAFRNAVSSAFAAHATSWEIATETETGIEWEFMVSGIEEDRRYRLKLEEL